MSNYMESMPIDVLFFFIESISSDQCKKWHAQIDFDAPCSCARGVSGVASFITTDEQLQ